MPSQPKAGSGSAVRHRQGIGQMISKMSNVLNKLRTDRKGVTALEYGMIAALIAAVIAGTVQTIGTRANTALGTVRDTMPAAAGR